MPGASSKRQSALKSPDSSHWPSSGRVVHLPFYTVGNTFLPYKKDSLFISKSTPKPLSGSVHPESSVRFFRSGFWCILPLNRRGFSDYLRMSAWRVAALLACLIASVQVSPNIDLPLSFSVPLYRFCPTVTPYQPTPSSLTVRR